MLSTNIVNTGPESWLEGISQEVCIHTVMNSVETVPTPGIASDLLLCRPQQTIVQHVFELLPMTLTTLSITFHPIKISSHACTYTSLHDNEWSFTLLPWMLMQPFPLPSFTHLVPWLHSLAKQIMLQPSKLNTTLMQSPTLMPPSDMYQPSSPLSSSYNPGSSALRPSITMASSKDHVATDVDIPG